MSKLAVLLGLKMTCGLDGAHHSSWATRPALVVASLDQRFPPWPMMVSQLHLTFCVANKYDKYNII